MHSIYSKCKASYIIWNKGNKRSIMETSFSMLKRWVHMSILSMAPHVQAYFLWLFRLCPFVRHLGEEESWDTSYALCPRECVLGWCCTSSRKGLSCCNLFLQIWVLFLHSICWKRVFFLLHISVLHIPVLYFCQSSKKSIFTFFVGC